MRASKPSLLCLFLIIVPVLTYAEKSPGEHVDDATVTARVKFALTQQSAQDAVDINVETSKGIVQLSGWVRSAEVKDSAERIANGAEGVTGVSNRLLVKSGKRSAGRALDDSLLAAKVKLALSENESTSAVKINVEVREAVVELSGFVDTYEERNAAVDLVEDIDGVDRIINSIDITPR